MRILQVVHQYPPRWVGGTELYTHHLARALIQRGHQVQVFTRGAAGPGISREALEGVPVWRCGSEVVSDRGLLGSMFYAPDMARGFAQTLRETKPEVVHFQHLLGLPTDVYWQAAHAGVPAMLTLHDYWYVCANTKLLTNYGNHLCAGPRLWLNCARCGLAKIRRRWGWASWPAAIVFAARDLRLRRVLRHAQLLIAPSHFLRQIFLCFGMAPDRIEVVPTGIEVSAQPLLPLPVARPLQVVYLGAIAPLKGVQVLIDAFSQLPETARLTVIGDVHREPDFARQLQQVARHPGIGFVGQKPRAEIWALLDAADVVVTPSLWYENSPLVVQEAFARGRPVVASRLGALAEMVRDQVDGLLFTPGDAAELARTLSHLHFHRETLQQLAANIRPPRRIQDLAADMEKVYRRLSGYPGER